MKGWKIFVQSLRLVFANLPQALRMSAVPYAIASAVMAWFFVANGRLMAKTQLTPQDVQDFSFLPLFLFLVVGIVAYLWIAVSWHRFVLLREGGTGLLPPFHGGRMLGYFGRALLIGLIMVLVGVVVGIVIGLMATTGSFALVMVGTLILTFIIMVVFYRLSPILPAVALDQPIGMGEAWRQTKGGAGDILIVALISAVVSFLIQLPMELGTVDPAAPLSIVYTVVTGWLQFMVGLSILTTIYGHYVEGRSID